MFKNKSQLLITHSQFLPSPPFPLQGTQEVKSSVLFCLLKKNLLLQSYFMCLSTRLFSCPASRNKRATYPLNALSFPTLHRPMGMSGTDSLEGSRVAALIRKATVAVTFLVTGIHHTTQSNISRKRMVVAHSAGRASTVVWKARDGGLVPAVMAGCSRVPYTRKQRESRLVLILYSQLESLVQSGIPAPGMVPHTFKLVFPLQLVLSGTTITGTLRGMSKPSQGTKRLTIATTS